MSVISKYKTVSIIFQEKCCQNRAQRAWKQQLRGIQSEPNQINTFFVDTLRNSSLQILG